MSVRAYALNAKTFTITHELPFTSLNVSNRLNGIGSWSMDMPVSYTDPNGTELFTSENFATNKTAIAIVSDKGNIMLGLFEQEQGDFDEDTETLRIGGPDLSLGYMARRQWIAARTTYTSTDLFTVGTNIVNNTNFLGLGTPIDVLYEPDSTSGVLTTITLDLADRKTLYELFNDLANVGGFEFMSTVTGDQENGFVSGVLMGYPSIYRRTGYVLELNKNVKKLGYTIDGRNYANITYVGGAAKGPWSPVLQAVSSEAFVEYPYYMEYESYNDTSNLAALQARANRALQLRQNPPRRFDILIDHTDPDCTLGTFRLGDEFRMIANRGRLSVDSFFRVESWALTVDSDGSEDVRLSMFETGTF